jgi:hypothetical protein
MNTRWTAWEKMLVGLRERVGWRFLCLILGWLCQEGGLSPEEAALVEADILAHRERHFTYCPPGGPLWQDNERGAVERERFALLCQRGEGHLYRYPPDIRERMSKVRYWRFRGEEEENAANAAS